MEKKPILIQNSTVKINNSHCIPVCPVKRSTYLTGAVNPALGGTHALTLNKISNFWTNTKQDVNPTKTPSGCAVIPFHIHHMGKWVKCF
jgi:hypothetical protein